MAGVYQKYLEAMIQQDGVEVVPVHAGGFHGHGLDPAFPEEPCQFVKVPGKAAETAYRFDDRRVEWFFLDSKCKQGEWYEADGLICFTYEDNPDPQCWSFVEGANGLIARFENEPNTTELYEAQDQGQEMLCLGPEVGVSYKPVPRADLLKQ